MSYQKKVWLGCCTVFWYGNNKDLNRGPGILLAESQKSTEKVPENRKKYRKLGRKPENAILESQKVEKNLRKARKSIFFCRKPETDPPIPSPLNTCWWVTLLISYFSTPREDVRCVHDHFITLRVHHHYFIPLVPSRSDA